MLLEALDTGPDHVTVLVVGGGGSGVRAIPLPELDDDQGDEPGRVLS